MSLNARVAMVLVLATACAQEDEPAPRAPADATEPVANEAGRVPPPGPYAPGFDALHYGLQLHLPGQGTEIEGNAEIDILVVEPRSDTLRLDLEGLRVTGIELGVNASAPGPVDFRHDDGFLYIPTPRAAGPGDTLRLRVGYAGTPDDGLVIGRTVHGAPSIFADNWPNRARYWFPSIDHPSDKATVEFEVTAPEDWEVIANGDAQPVAASGGERVWRSVMSDPIPTYVMVIGAADMVSGVIDRCAPAGPHPARTGDCIPVTFWTFPQDSARGAELFRRAGQMVTYYSELVGAFPYDELAHAQSATRFGGMENATVIFYSEQRIADGALAEGTIAHETAHQWFGDAVTPGHWSDLWLSEGFATYFGMLFFEHADGPDDFRTRVRDSWAEYLASDVTDIAMVDSTRVPDNDLFSLLNRNSYNKGGAVLHMLRGLLGDDTFFASVRAYFERHNGATARTRDLQAAFEEVAGQDLGWFFDQWAYRPGYPVLSASHVWDADARVATVTIEQVQQEDWPTFRLPIEIVLRTPRGAVRRAVELRERRAEFRIESPAAPESLELDPDGWVLKRVVPAVAASGADRP